MTDLALLVLAVIGICGTILAAISGWALWALLIYPKTGLSRWKRTLRSRVYR